MSSPDREGRLALRIAGFAAGVAAGYGLDVARAQLQSRFYPHYWNTHPYPEGPEPRSKGLPAPVTMHVVGDSAAAGVGPGFIDPRKGYVGLVEKRLENLAGRRVRTSNLAIPGASSWLLMEHQLPRFRALRERVGPADVTLCIIGANDIAGREYTLDGFIWTAERLYAQLPAGTVVGTIPSFGFDLVNRRVTDANAVIRALAARHDLELADLFAITSALDLRSYLARTGGDFFHPNAAGYRLWTHAIWPAVRRAYLRQGRTQTRPFPANTSL
ncbi:SGNH/GDSL hydrolase family protein [Brevibacterium sp. 91QC2O2]|uniref:SGNH/GDSL hydrolase family protein n=1 Tax=Brevibacterium sp. 91QC2O2 TaxID=2968458 RepID=UPI00211BE24F|nr:SGNH/GDSL hydrolase family protein [Brevibacterium sp. 91QC2O2]MCQ9367902.1 SGNH/GDSL hydrolase family protein [Brevibacterium sp. 91QC2O2]